MGKRERRKGLRYERELVQQLSTAGINARRMWGSDGRSAGLGREVDLVVEGLTAQARRRARIPAWLKCDTDVVFTREDRGETYVIMPLEVFVKLLKKSNSGE